MEEALTLDTLNNYFHLHGILHPSSSTSLLFNELWPAMTNFTVSLHAMYISLYYMQTISKSVCLWTFSVNIYSERWGLWRFFGSRQLIPWTFRRSVNIFWKTKFLFLLFPCLWTFCRAVKIAVFKGTKSATATCFTLFQFIAVCSQFVATYDFHSQTYITS